MAGCGLTALLELERRYDGPIPEPLRHGLIAQLPLVAAEREAEFFTCLVRDQLVALRYWRRSGTAPEGLAKDLALYRRWRRQSRAAAAQFRVEIRPSAGDAP